ncbi:MULTISPECIES: hypothetical protein [Rahnella]|jgi:hypothetical protein|uniref:hypothetical protein n=1 Tax=Rahnella TaxID=34037 RepID=UPI00101D5B0A|nr:hypothetical protein [Rahnella variigena]RYJ12491.1 hypothetical protein C5Y41_23765 [Rahnella variigena]
MTEEQIWKARYYSACDIAHRWFAFFEGQTEEVSRHLDIFTPYVRLVHAGTHLLAEGKDGMDSWLKSLPYEKGSHFIRRFEFIPGQENEATVNMDIGYQRVESDLTVGGALSEYRTTLLFGEGEDAFFTFMQKTPVYQNPGKVFRESFSENRVHSFIARFFQLMLTARSGAVSTIVSGNADENTRQNLPAFLRSADPDGISIEETDILAMKSTLLLPVDGTERRLSLELAEEGGRYLVIRHANWS